MQDKTKVSLISLEIYGLWNTYTNDTLVRCMLKYFLNRVDDEEIRPILQHAYDISNGHIQVATDKLNQEGLPIPQGFTDDDVDINAPRLYTDPFYLFYLVNLSMYGMGNYSLILSYIARTDLRDFFSTCITESIEIYNKTANLLQSEGLFIRAPRVEANKQVDYIDKQNFFSGGFLGKKRALLTSEITTIFGSLRYNLIGGAMTTGFAQVTKTKNVKEYFLRCRKIASTRIEKLTSIFLDENIAIPSTSESFVTDSTVPPFSEKLMLNNVIFLFGVSISQDGSSLSYVMRHDLQAHFTGTLIESGKCAEDGLDILIQNRWMEQPPQAISHELLAMV
jgi:hypothetical protein